MGNWSSLGVQDALEGGLEAVQVTLGGQFEGPSGFQVALGGQLEGPSGVQVALQKEPSRAKAFRRSLQGRFEGATKAFRRSLQGRSPSEGGCEGLQEEVKHISRALQVHLEAFQFFQVSCKWSARGLEVHLKSMLEGPLESKGT